MKRRKFVALLHGAAAGSSRPLAAISREADIG
jgi:hypothetical protein